MISHAVRTVVDLRANFNYSVAIACSLAPLSARARPARGALVVKCVSSTLCYTGELDSSC